MIGSSVSRSAANALQEGLSGRETAEDGGVSRENHVSFLAWTTPRALVGRNLTEGVTMSSINKFNEKIFSKEGL